jgi:hypothetical protein
MLRQQGGDNFWARNFGGSHHFTKTIQVKNKNIFAEIALTGITVLGEDFHESIAFISQIVSDNGVENFEGFEGRRVISRRNVTSITFRINVYNSQASARWIINFWS